VKLYEVIWKERFVKKIADKHAVTTEEVEEVLFSYPHVRKAEKGRVKGEDLYVAYGQTRAGRYLVAFFIRKPRAESKAKIYMLPMVKQGRVGIWLHSLFANLGRLHCQSRPVT